MHCAGVVVYVTRRKNSGHRHETHKTVMKYLVALLFLENMFEIYETYQIQAHFGKQVKLEYKII